MQRCTANKVNTELMSTLHTFTADNAQTISIHAVSYFLWKYSLGTALSMKVALSNILSQTFPSL